MSVLETPRIYFKGNISWDPVTTNNYPGKKRLAGYDEDTLDSVWDGDAVAPEQVEEFRQQAIEQVPAPPDVSGTSWNPDGTYRSNFFDTKVSGVDTGSGLDTSDALVGAPVGFSGMLVDAEPYGPFTSQLFFDEMSFGIPGGCRILGKRQRRFDDRNINFGANPSNQIIAGLASVSWQTVFPKVGHAVLEEFDSPAVAALRAAFSHDDVLGLMVRWNSYRTIYYNDKALRNGNQAQSDAQQAIMAKLREGGWQPNPARSLVVGVVGLWRRGECPTEPGDRTLISTLTDISTPGGDATMGTAFMKLDTQAEPPTLTLDLQNSIPCRNQETDKVDLGTLSVIAADPPPAVAMADLVDIPVGAYDRAAYEATSGIVTIPLPRAMQGLEDYVFSIKGQGDAPTYLREIRYRALALEPNVYVNQGDTRQITVQVYDRGEPAGSGLTVTWTPFSAVGTDDTTHGTATTDANGQVFVPLDTSTDDPETNKGKVYALIFQVGTSAVVPLPKFNPMVMPYVYIRVLPKDDKIAGLSPTWDNVYANVLANFKAIAPCMDNWLRLDEEAQVRAYAPLVKRLTDPSAFEDFRYMPVTRDLSPGQRTLLYNWINSPASDGLKAASSEPPPQHGMPDPETLPDIAGVAASHRGDGE
ncbi:Ig-like domain-containing protein [uncultured Erythrobacter sp.]|uniref:Ig-like domain-containing protein n=1 Tax=uncultured Erythrobacter sp. TaxID=263913 RepID=UPI002617115F|nr:Ig-like domain-containing protein [uncultured Erythrobacter sp.]